VVCRKRLGTCVVALGRARTREICNSMHLVVENVLFLATVSFCMHVNLCSFLLDRA
jgi:hypothetical protein